MPLVSIAQLIWSDPWFQALWIPPLQSTGARCLNLGFGKRQLSSAAATFQCYVALLLRLLAAASCGTQQNLILFHLHTSSMHHRWDHRHNIGDERRNWGVRMLCKNLVSLISNGQGWMVKYATLALIFCSRSLHLSSTNSQNICLSRYSVGTRAGGLWHNQLLRGCQAEGFKTLKVKWARCKFSSWQLHFTLCVFRSRHPSN